MTRYVPRSPRRVYAEITLFGRFVDGGAAGAALTRSFGQQLGYLLEKLAKADVDRGRTLLDDAGRHPISFVLAGNGSGTLTMGRST